MGFIQIQDGQFDFGEYLNADYFRYNRVDTYFKHALHPDFVSFLHFAGV